MATAPVSHPEFLLFVVLRLCLVLRRVAPTTSGEVGTLARPVVLKRLLEKKHWQTYRTFCTEYDKAARTLDASLMGTYPSRAQLHRWLSGDLKGLPYPDHCRVLEVMFPGVTAEEMFAAADDYTTPQVPGPDRRIQSPSQEDSDVHDLAGKLVDLTLGCSIDIDPEGWASVTYCHEIMNLTDRPMKRMTREQWFETTSGTLKIEALPDSERKVNIQRIHDTANMSKFACHLSPAIMPGETATISYRSQGGRFVYNHYWRQSIPRYTKKFVLTIRNRETSMLLNCTAIEEQLDGSEISAIEDLVCSPEGDDSLVTVTRENLQPGQAITVRWEVSRAAPR